jgi:hypothetical protein
MASVKIWIRDNGQKKRVTVDGQVVSKNFAVHKTYTFGGAVSSRYSLTHIGSGCCITSLLSTQEEAQDAALKAEKMPIRWATITFQNSEKRFARLPAAHMAWLRLLSVGQVAKLPTIRRKATKKSINGKVKH